MLNYSGGLLFFSLRIGQVSDGAVRHFRSQANGFMQRWVAVNGQRQVFDQLGAASALTGRQGATAGTPGEGGGANAQSLCLGLFLSQTGPGDFRVGVGDRWDRHRSEAYGFASGDFGGHMALVAGFVRQHRLADQIADGEDVIEVGAQLFIDGDKAALVDVQSGFVGLQQIAIGAAADGDQDGVEIGLCCGADTT